MILADGWISHAWAAGFLLGIFFGVTFIAPFIYLIWEEFKTDRYKRDNPRAPAEYAQWQETYTPTQIKEMQPWD